MRSENFNHFSTFMLDYTLVEKLGFCSKEKTKIYV